MRLQLVVDGHLFDNMVKKYPKFADRIHEGLVDIFGEKGRLVIFLYFNFQVLASFIAQFQKEYRHTSRWRW